jgi:hypothetical protein
MDAARCLICNTKHWSREPCPATKGDARELAKSVLRQVQNEVTKTPQPVRTETTPVKTETVKTELPVKTAVKTGSPAVKTGFDKKAWMKTYMRDYMRQRRAALKAIQTVAASS